MHYGRGDYLGLTQLMDSQIRRSFLKPCAREREEVLLWIRERNKDFLAHDFYP